MAITSKATLKTCRKVNQNWLSDYAFASIGNSYEYDNISRIGYIGFDFDLTNKYITSITLKCHCIDAGLGAWATKTLEFYGYNPAGGTYPPSQVGAYLGSHSGGNFYYCSNTLTFNASSNPTLFNAMADYFAAGNNVLLIRSPNSSELDVKTHSYGEYSDNFLKMDSCTATIEYLDTALITYDLNGGPGTQIPSVRVPIGVEMAITDIIPDPPAAVRTKMGTVTYNVDADVRIDYNSEDWYHYHNYCFEYWCDGERGVGAYNFYPGDTFVPEHDITLFAIYAIDEDYVEPLTPPQATKFSTTVSRQINFDLAGGTCDDVLPESSTAQVWWHVVGWSDEASDRVIGLDEYIPDSDHSFVPIFETTVGDYSSITLPYASKEGHDLIGWADNTGNYIGDGGDSVSPRYDPTTFTALWMTRWYDVTIVDRFRNTILYCSSYEYGTTFTIPSFTARRGELTSSNERVTLSFDDSANSSFSIGDLEVPITKCYDFNNWFSATVWDDTLQMFVDLDGTDWKKSGTSFTVTNELEFACIYEPCPANDYIAFIAPQNTETNYGYRFQQWDCDIPNSSIDAGTLYPSKSSTIVGVTHGDHLTFKGKWAAAPDASGKNLYFNVNGQMKKALKTFVKDNDEYKEAIAIFIKVNGEWRTKAD